MRAILMLAGMAVAIAAPAAAFEDRVLEKSETLSVSRTYSGVADTSDFESSDAFLATASLSDSFASSLAFTPFDFQTGQLLGATLAVSLSYRDIASIGLSGGRGYAKFDERYLTFRGYGKGQLLALQEEFYKPSLTCVSQGSVCLMLSEAKGETGFAYDVTEAYGQTDFAGLPIALSSEGRVFFQRFDAPQPNFVATRDMGWDATFTLTWRYYEVAPGGLPPSVPEPASWALMIAGFGLAGAAARRARRQQA